VSDLFPTKEDRSFTVAPWTDSVWNSCFLGNKGFDCCYDALADGLCMIYSAHLAFTFLDEVVDILFEY